MYSVGIRSIHTSKLRIKRIKIKKNKINFIKSKSSLESLGKKKTEKILEEKDAEEGRAAVAHAHEHEGQNMHTPSEHPHHHNMHDHHRGHINRRSHVKRQKEKKHSSPTFSPSAIKAR